MYMCKVSKKTKKSLEQHVKYIQTTSSALWTYFSLYAIVIIVEFQQIYVGWAWETIVLDNKFSFHIYENYMVLWAGEIC